MLKRTFESIEFWFPTGGTHKQHVEEREGKRRRSEAELNVPTIDFDIRGHISLSSFPLFTGRKLTKQTLAVFLNWVGLVGDILEIL